MIRLSSITTGFRRFAKKQFLTEAHLNQIVDYFDDQIRLSRTCLSGTGVVCGFEVSCNRSQTWIKITQGLGISTDGDLFHIYKQLEGTDEKIIDFGPDEPCKFNHFKIYDTLEVPYDPHFVLEGSYYDDIYELLTERGNSEVFPLRSFESTQGFAIKDAVILLYLETYEQGAPVCSSMGCDNDGNEIISNYKVLLTSRATAEKINAHDSMIRRTNFGRLYYELPEVMMPRIITKPEDFESYTTLLESYTKPLLQHKVYEKLEDGFTILFTALDAPDQLAEVANKITNIFNFDDGPAPADIQYRYDLLKDLVDTYNEIKSLLRFMDTTDCCPDIKAFPKHLMLGEVSREREIDEDDRAVVADKYHCYEFRHGFYPSVAHSDQGLNICDTCSADPLDIDFEPGAVSTFREGSEDKQGNHAHHIVFVIDESGAFKGQMEYVKNALNAYVASVVDSNTYISIIGMSASIDNTRKDHVIYKRSTDPAVAKWINKIYGTSGPYDSNGGDYWGSAYQVIIDKIINTKIPTPNIVITLGDEGSDPYRATTGIKITVERAAQIKKHTKLFTYVIDNLDRRNELSGDAILALGSGAIASTNGGADLATTDYFLASNFSDLGIKIRNLNEALIHSNIFAKVSTADEVVLDSAGDELGVCYSEINDDEQYLNSLAKRAVLQLSNYNSGYKTIKITPSRALGELPKKAIPFYYNVGEELIAAWDYKKTVMGRHKTNLSYHSNLLAIQKPLEVCVEKDFYRIEGHQGRDYREVVDRLKVIRNEFKLEFNIVVLEISGYSEGVLEFDRSKRIAIEGERDIDIDIEGDAFTVQYLKKTTGLEHKAGVAPKGTFIIVYRKNELVIIGEGAGGVDSAEARVVKSKKGKGVKEFEEFEEYQPVVADFAIPHLCCDEKFISLSLPDKVVCIDRSSDDRSTIPFNVNPKDGVVKAIVPIFSNGGVVRDDDTGLYSFDPRRVSENLYGRSISFEVNNQPVGFSVKVYERPEFTVTTTITYNKLKTEATVVYKVEGDAGFDDFDFLWDFGDGDLSAAKPLPDGTVIKKYKLPVNETNTIQPTLQVSYDSDACPTNIFIDSITFDDPIVISLTVDSENICLDTSTTNIISVGYTVSPAGETIALKKTIPGVSITPATVDFDPTVFVDFNTPIAFTVLDEDTTATITVTRKPEFEISADPSKIVYNEDKTKATVTFEITGEGLPTSPALEWSFGDGTMLTGSSLTQVHEYLDLEALTDRKATIMVVLPGTICGNTSETLEIEFEAPPIPVVFTIQPDLCLDSSGTTLVDVPYTITPEGTVLELSATVAGVTVLPGVLQIDPAIFIGFDVPIVFKAGIETLDQKITITRKPEFQINFDPEEIIYTEGFFAATVIFEVIGAYIPPGAQLQWDFGDGEQLTGSELTLQHVYVNLDGFPDRTVQVTLTITDSVCGETTDIATITFEAAPIPVELSLARNEVCLDTSNCTKPVHIAIGTDTSLAIDEDEAKDIKKALFDFVSGQQNTERLLTYLSMEARISFRNFRNELAFERYITAITRKAFLDSIAKFPDRLGSYPEGTNDWLRFFNNISTGYGTIIPDIVVVIVEGLQTNNFSDIRDDIKILRGQGTHVFYFALSTGAYVTEAADGSIIPAEPGSNNLVTTLTQLIGREPVLVSSDFSDVETADYYAPRDFKDLGRFLSRLNSLTEKEGDCSSFGSGEEFTEGGVGFDIPRGRNGSISLVSENVTIIPISNVSPESAIVSTAIDYDGVQVSGNNILIDPKEFIAFDESIGFTVNAQPVPETLIIHEKPYFDFNFIDLHEFGSGDTSYIPDGVIITEGEVLGGGSGFQSTTVVCNAFNLNDFDESEYNFFWDFGDGATSEERNPVHRYRNSDSISVTITLRVTGGFCEAQVYGSVDLDLFT